MPDTIPIEEQTRVRRILERWLRIENSLIWFNKNVYFAVLLSFVLFYQKGNFFQMLFTIVLVGSCSWILFYLTRGGLLRYFAGRLSEEEKEALRHAIIDNRMTDLEGAKDILRVSKVVIPAREYVRASQQTTDDTLLRAVHATETTPQDQLLRPAQTEET